MKNLITAIGAAALLASSQAYAGLFLKMTDNVTLTDYTCADGAACDADGGIGVSTTGIASFSANLVALGNFTITTGQSQPFLSAPGLMSSNVNGQLTGIGSATIYVTVTDFDIADLSDMASLSTSATPPSTSGVVATWDLLLDADNGLYTGVSIADTLLTGNDAATDIGSLLGGDDEFSLTLKTTITVGANDVGQDYDNLATVTDIPEPSILALLSAGLLGLGVAHRRTKK